MCLLLNPDRYERKIIPETKSREGENEVDAKLKMHVHSSGKNVETLLKGLRSPACFLQENPASEKKITVQTLLTCKLVCLSLQRSNVFCNFAFGFTQSRFQEQIVLLNLGHFKASPVPLLLFCER